MENFIEEMTEIFEVDNIDINQELESFECWDSLTILSIIAFADENCNVTLSAAEVSNSKTVSGLQELIKNKMS